jgi:RNA polymerase sigma-70 factor (ECF subfamily)
VGRLRGSDREQGVEELVPEVLLDRCRMGDEQAWAELVDLTYREVYSLCLRILRDPDDAAEAAQEAYVKAWRGLRGFRGDARFTTWMYRVATNAAITTRRSRQRRWRHETGTDEEMLVHIPSTASTEESAHARLDLHELERAIGSLPALYRDAVVLRDVYGFSIDELARHLGISETAAKVRVHRGRKRLREMVWSEAQDKVSEPG